MARLALAWPSKRTKDLPRQLLLSRTRRLRSSPRALAQPGLLLGSPRSSTRQELFIKACRYNPTLSQLTQSLFGRSAQMSDNEKCRNRKTKRQRVLVGGTRAAP